MARPSAPSPGAARLPRRFVRHACAAVAGGALVLTALLDPAAAQPTAADPMAPRPALPAPPSLRFPTPPEAATRELTLEEAVRIALDNAPAIIATFGDYVAAQQRVAQAFSAMLPQLSASASLVRTDAWGRSTTGGSVSTLGQGTLAASQRLFDFGKTWAATDAAKAGAEVFREEVERIKDLIVLNVKENYFNQLLASRLVVVSAQALERAELNLKSARGFFDVGTRPKSDVTRAEVDVANARVDLIRAQNAVTLTRVSLNQAMGIAVDAPTRVVDILRYSPLTLDRGALVAEALARRPEYRQARARVEAGEARVRQTFRDFFPELFGVGSWGGSRFVNEGVPPPATSQEWQVGVELRWSIFDGGNKIARWREEKASLEAAVARVKEQELLIWREVEQAHVSVLEAEELIGAAQKTVESAQENFRLNQGRFDAGVGSILDLTTAQLELTRAQASEARALADYRIAIARLERALGRR